MKTKMKSNGFTLIELATVMVIISVLAAIATPNFLNATIRAKVARSLAEQELLSWALESYCVDCDVYPHNLAPGKNDPGDLTPLTTPIAYISSLPLDIFLAPVNVDKNEFINNKRGGNLGYFYVNFIQISEESVSLVPFGKSGSANYVVYGYSPSFSDIFDPMKPETFIQYNPSNGTTSDGNIVTFGP